MAESVTKQDDRRKKGKIQRRKDFISVSSGHKPLMTEERHKVERREENGTALPKAGGFVTARYQKGNGQSKLSLWQTCAVGMSGKKRVKDEIRLERNTLYKRKTFRQNGP